VAKRTGISADTLRIWERRYGFPKPGRRPGGSRVYSSAEVEKLELVTRALDAGFRAGEVVPLPNADIERLIDAAGPANASVPDEPGTAEDSLHRVVEALMADDVSTVRSTLRSAALALGPRRFVTSLAHPLAVRVGALWENGEIEVRHEHLASACLTTQLRMLFGAFDDDGGRKPVVVLATLPGEPHVLPLDMVAVYLAARHASPHLLGPDTPPEQIAAAARGLRADAVGISVSPVADRRSVSAHVRKLARELPERTALWIGGAGAPNVARDLPRVVRFASWEDVDAALSGRRAGG